MEELLWIVLGVGCLLFALHKPWLTVLLILLLLLAYANYDQLRPLLESALGEPADSREHRQHRHRSKRRSFAPTIEPVFGKRENASSPSADDNENDNDDSDDSPTATPSLSELLQRRIERIFNIRTHQVERMVDYYETMASSFSSSAGPSSPMSTSFVGDFGVVEQEPEDCQ